MTITRQSIFLLASAGLMTCLMLGLQAFAQSPHHRSCDDARKRRELCGLISLTVTVKDKQGQPVVGLQREDFLVYDDQRTQEITSLNSDNSPISWGLLIDLSERMGSIISDVSKAALHLVDQQGSRDEMFILGFNDRVDTLCEFSSDRKKLRDSTQALTAGGRSALYDAVATALDKFKQAKNQKKVLVLVTDGHDNASQRSFAQLLEQAGEQDVLIYSAGTIGWQTPWEFSGRGQDWRGDLKKLAKVTGASAHFSSNISKCLDAMNAIAVEVAGQYRLEYRLNNPTPSQKWRKINVRLFVASSQDGRVKSIRTREYIAARRCV